MVRPIETPVHDNMTRVGVHADLQSKATGKIFVEYRVVRGDSIWKIAHANHVSVSGLVRINRLDSAARIDVGQLLLLPSPTNREQMLSDRVALRIPSADKLGRNAVSKMYYADPAAMPEAMRGRLSLQMSGNIGRTQGEGLPASPIHRVNYQTER